MDERDIEMTDCDATDEANLLTDHNKPINRVDIEIETHDDEYSQDLFDSSADLTSLTQTPKIGKEQSSPCQPTVPTIPKSLIPFISTVNESWTSDLETPQAKTAVEINLQRSERGELLSKSCETMERKGSAVIRSNGVIPDVTTPNGYFVARVDDESFPTSPILNTMKKRRRPKRRILKSLVDTSMPMDSSKEIGNVCHNSAGDAVRNDNENLESEATSLKNNTSSVDDATFVIDKNCSIHNSNIYFVQNEINHEEIDRLTEDQSVIDNVQDSTLIASDEEKCLMNERLQSFEDSGEISLNETFENEKEITNRDSESANKEIIDSANFESSLNKTHEESLAELVKEIKELDNEPVPEYKYTDIPMDIFTRDAQALENADMIQIKPPSIKSNVKKQWGLISFTQMCLLEQENCGNGNLGVKETEKSESIIEISETTTKPEAPSLKEDRDIFSHEKEEPVIDIEEFSPWFYQSNDIKSEFLNNTNTAENLVKENAESIKAGSEIATKQKIAIDEKGETLAAEKDGENIDQTKLSKKTTSGDHQFDAKAEICTNSPQLSIGFSTASGKRIKVSEDRVKKAAKLYEEIALQDAKHYDAGILCDKTGDRETSNKENEETIPQNSFSSMGFSTAGGKPIKVSRDKLIAASKLYEEIGSQDVKHCDASILRDKIPDRQKKNKEYEATFPRDSFSSIGFSTASGKPIKVSEDKLKTACQLFEEIAKQDPKMFREAGGDYRTNNKENETNVLRDSYCSMGFATASGKPIRVSEAKLKEATKIFNETNSSDSLQSKIDLLEVPLSRGIKRKFEHNGNDSPKICGDDSSVGFRTASGKPLIISETAMKRAKIIYDSVDILKSQFPPNNDLKKDVINSLDTRRSESSDKNYADTRETDIKSLFPIDLPLAAFEEPNTTSNVKQSEQLDVVDPSDAPVLHNLVGELQQTDKARDQTRKSFDREGHSFRKRDCVDRTISKRYSDPTTSVSTGFNTASGKAIQISNQALSNARNLLDEDQNSFISGPLSRKIDAFVKFSSDEGAPTKISDQVSLNEEILLPVEEKSCKSSQLNCTAGNKAAIQFSTADEKPIRVSEDALLKTRNINKLLPEEQENTSPFNSSAKRSSAAMETPESSNAPLSKTPALKSVSEKISSDETPVGVSILQTSKRIRFNSDLQARKLFDDTDEETEYREQFNTEINKNSLTLPHTNSNYAHHLLSHQRNKNASFARDSAAGLYAKFEMFEANDRLGVPKLEAQKSSPLNQAADVDATQFEREFTRSAQEQKDRKIPTFSEEITASTEALLADEENSFDGKTWASAITCSPTLIEDRDVSVKPITLGGDTVQEGPTSPKIGAKFRSRKKVKRNKKNLLKKDAGSLKSVIDTGCIANDGLEERNSQQSSGVATPTSDSSKDSHRSVSRVIDTALISKLEKLEETSTRGQALDNLCENSEGVTIDEMDDYFLENRLAATLEQEKQIRAKKKFKPKPNPGKLFIRKTENRESRVTWSQATRRVPPTPRTSQELTSLGIGLEVMEVTAATALHYKFKCIDLYSKDEILANAHGLEIGDGGRLVFDENGYAGVAEFERAFMASSGVDPSLLPQRWVENHYRWIVWKLASMDRMKFGDLSMPRMLTPGNVMEQLKYRYDREIDKSERPALRRIIEKDDPPCRRMILCVATITKLESIQSVEKSPRLIQTSHLKIELTDGWYSITATIDSAMAHLIAIGKVREGTKLVTCRAELLNCEQGCSPLEVNPIPGEASLKIHTNSTRRSRWDAKLGYCKNAGPIPTSLPAILPYGGLIGKVNTTIARVYPIQYFEKNCGGQSVFRNNKCEDKAAMIYERERQAQIDAIYAKARADFEAKNRKRSKIYSSTHCNKSLKNSSEEPGNRLYSDRWNDCDNDSDQQSYDASSEEAFRNEVESILRDSLPPPRKVTLVLKVRVMEGDSIAILTLWSPSEDIVYVIREGNRVAVHNVQTSGKRSGELQLTAGHQSFVKPEKSIVSNSFPQRCLTSIPEIAVAGFNPPFGEFDTVGIVVSLGPAPHGMKNFEVVNLASPLKPEGSDSAYLSVLFWEGIGAHGFSDILSVGATVACTNLQWRRCAPRTVPMAYSTEYSTFTRNPRQIYLRSAFDSIKNQIKDLVTFVSQCASEIAIEHQKKPAMARSPAVQGTPSKMSPSAASLQDKFAPGVSPRTPQGLVNSGKTTPAKYSIQRRLEKLQWYAEPPDLSPVSLNHSSNKVNQKFVPPARTPENIECVNRRNEVNFKK